MSRKDSFATMKDFGLTLALLLGACLLGMGFGTIYDPCPGIPQYFGAMLMVGGLGLWGFLINRQFRTNK